MKDLLQAQIFSGFPSWKTLVYKKELTPKSPVTSMDGDLDCHDFRFSKSKKIMTPKILRFEVTETEKAPRPLYLASIISKEEKLAWQSFQDVLEHTMGLAQNGLRGFFGLDVLCVDIQAGIQNFNPNDLSRLIINHARDLGPDQKTLVRYGQLFALLHYRAPAEWGKIEVKTHVEFFSRETASSLSNHVSEASVRAALLGESVKKKSGDQLDLLLKRLLNESGKELNAIYLVSDLSVHSIWDRADADQQQRMHTWLEKETRVRNQVPPEIYFYHSTSRTLFDLSRYF